MAGLNICISIRLYIIRRVRLQRWQTDCVFTHTSGFSSYFRYTELNTILVIQTSTPTCWTKLTRLAMIIHTKLNWHMCVCHFRNLRNLHHAWGRVETSLCNRVSDVSYLCMYQVYLCIKCIHVFVHHAWGRVEICMLSSMCTTKLAHTALSSHV